MRLVRLVNLYVMMLLQIDFDSDYVKIAIHFEKRLLKYLYHIFISINNTMFVSPSQSFENAFVKLVGRYSWKYRFLISKMLIAYLNTENWLCNSVAACTLIVSICVISRRSHS